MWNYYGGVSFSDVTFVIDGEWRIDILGTWDYGEYIIIDKDNDVKFKKGSIVSLYVGGQYIGSWTCYDENPSAGDIVTRLFKMKPKGKMNLNVNSKKIIKILRKIKI